MARRKKRGSIHSNNYVSLDVHGMTLGEAMRTIVEAYNERVSFKKSCGLIVIHGHGASGIEVVIGPKLREHLDQLGHPFLPGGLSGCNPGETVIMTSGRLPPAESRLEHLQAQQADKLRESVVRVCHTKREWGQLFYRLRRFDITQVRDCVNTLIREGALIETKRGGRRFVQRKSDAPATVS